MVQHSAPLALLAHPYDRLRPLEPRTTAIRALRLHAGSAVVWCMGAATEPGLGRVIKSRPGGLALLVILPPDADLMASSGLSMELHQLRPQGILPFHSTPSASELSQVLRRPPGDLAGEVTDYLRWRGLGIDRDTIHLIRRILDLSAELRSISSVSRGMYVSRRALGRRLTTRGLPVPSHWLQMGRLLRVAARLQNSDATVSSVAFEHGYPDGFSLSNQMERLIGHRPSEVRLRLGWEWLVESWLRREAESGRLTCCTVLSDNDEAQPVAMSRPSRAPRRRGSSSQGSHA
ncbi:MAG: helix-turn-helix domain-containing protein [Gemmatimonadota bacterium]|nr:helix-turn-helix domain-containing protein [Gemmatimonadota bacterium]MDH3422228.1 helix-turn-helix domain-containing protein [Gemmatimonadota bacterium]